MTDIVVTGALGQLGRVVARRAASLGAVVGVDQQEMMLEDAAAVRAVLTDLAPRCVLHCGALTDVDGCENDPWLADRVNSGGTASIARVCAELGATMVYVSTDFVFDGTASEPYREEVEPNPVSEYGRSKLGGERAVSAADLERWYVMRTSWVFGPGGKNFPRAILGRARSGQPLRVVDDQVGCPTYTEDLAEAMLDLVASNAENGVYHTANEGICSWHQFACAILAAADLGDIEVGHMSSAELDRPAPRPAFSALDCTRLASVRGRRLPKYQTAIERYLSEEAT